LISFINVPSTGATKSRQEMEDLGINSRICQYTQEVSSTVTARKNAKQEAEETVNTRLDKRSQLIKERIQDLEEKHNHNLHRWTTMQLDDLAQDTDDLREQLERIEQLKRKEEPLRLQNMIRRQYKKDIIKKRIGLRKKSTGRPQSIDEDNERFVLECIENKATAHGRRHDPVLYLNHRVKKRDFLKLVNYNRARRGLKRLKSATTVYNRASPRNVRSIQAKNHLGMVLFCSKKPPKLQENDNVLTHHQRAFKKNILLRQCHESNGEGLTFNLFLSRDDKAYICPGTGTGTVHIIIWCCDFIV
jgi:hypothetical protein